MQLGPGSEDQDITLPQYSETPSIPCWTVYKTVGDRCNSVYCRTQYLQCVRIGSSL